MNRKMVRTIAVTAALISLSAVPVFAAGRDNRGFNRAGSKGNCVPANCTPGTGMQGNYQTMGTVSSINTNDSTITVKNADGKEIQVHINPATFVSLAGSASKELSLKDIKTGDWVAVNTFNTETTVVEARRVFISRN